MFSPLCRETFGVIAGIPCGPSVVDLAGGTPVARAEERERSEHDAPQPDQQADLHLLLGVSDHDQKDRYAAESDCTEYAYSAKDASLAWTRSKGRHAASLAMAGRCSVSPLCLFVVS